MNQLPKPTHQSSQPLKFKDDMPDNAFQPIETDPDQVSAQLTSATGMLDQDAACHLIGQIITAKNANNSPAKVNELMGLLHGLAPKDPLEGLLISQVVIAQELSLEFAARALQSNQTSDGVNNNINRATKLMRVFNAQVETLIRYRTQGQQVIQVQHVNVNAGGQALVGNIQTSDINRG